MCPIRCWITFALERRNDVSFVVGSTEKLRQNLDRLPTRQKVVEGNTSDTSHLDIVDKTHQLVEQSLRKICVLDRQLVSLERLKLLSLPLNSTPPTVAGIQVYHFAAP
jgi:hypothetical protein